MGRLRYTVYQQKTVNISANEQNPGQESDSLKSETKDQGKISEVWSKITISKLQAGILIRYNPC